MIFWACFDLEAKCPPTSFLALEPQNYKDFAAFFSEFCKRHSSTHSNISGGNVSSSLLDALHWEHPPLKQRMAEVFAFRKQHEDLKGVLQTVLGDDDRSAVAEVMTPFFCPCFVRITVGKEKSI